MSNPDIGKHTWELICYNGSGHVIKRMVRENLTLEEVEEQLKWQRDNNEEVEATTYRLIK